jgi:hypothetical protein
MGAYSMEEFVGGIAAYSVHLLTWSSFVLTATVPLRLS